MCVQLGELEDVQGRVDAAEEASLDWEIKYDLMKARKNKYKEAFVKQLCRQVLLSVYVHATLLRSCVRACVRTCHVRACHVCVCVPRVCVRATCVCVCVCARYLISSCIVVQRPAPSPLFCYCGKNQDDPGMIECSGDASTCPGKTWYHKACVGLKSVPRGTFRCQFCRAQERT